MGDFCSFPKGSRRLSPSPSAVAAPDFCHPGSRCSVQGSQLCRRISRQEPGPRCTAASLPLGFGRGSVGGQRSENGNSTGDSAIPTRGERKPGKKTDALCWTPGICQTMCHVSDKMEYEGLRNLARNYGIRALPQDRNLFSHTHSPTCNTASVTTIRNRPAHPDTQTWTSLSASPARGDT